MNYIEEYKHLKRSLKNRIENVKEIIDNYNKLPYLICSKKEYEETLLEIELAYMVACKRLRKQIK